MGKSVLVAASDFIDQQCISREKELSLLRKSGKRDNKFYLRRGYLNALDDVKYVIHKTRAENKIEAESKIL